jgi:hypothetical protein
MLKSDRFTNAVDPLTGMVSFSLPLFDLPGPDNLKFNFALHYSSAVQDIVSHWNLTHPTSSVGLGWSLPVWRIFIDQPYGVDLAEEKVFLSVPGTFTSLIPSQINADGTQSWLAEKQPFWKIVYTPTSNSWLVTDENGIQHLFGGNGGSEVAVAVADWLAISNQIDDQRQVPVAWNRVSMIDLFGNRIRFAYNLVQSSLNANGLSYTQASYLTKITGAFGDEIILGYENKSADEYAYPYTNPNPPNAYQARVETQYLQSVAFQPATASSPSGTVLLGSDTQFKGGNGSTPFTKRTLNSVSRSYSSGRSLPPLKFTYATNLATDPLPGAMTAVTLPTGGTITYNYSRAGGDSGVLQYSGRDIAITPPAVQGVTFSDPQLYFEDSYTVVIWKGSDNSIAVVSYRWEGRWLAGPTTSIAGAYQGSAQIEVSLAPALFAVYAGGKVACFYKDPKTPDGWIAPQNPFVPALTGNEAIVSLVTGDCFAAVLGANSGTLCRFDFTNLAWSAATATQPIPLSNPLATTMTGQGNSIFICAATGTAVAASYLIRQLDGTWKQANAQTSWVGGSAPQLYSAMGSAGAILAGASQFGSTHSASAFACHWSINNAAPSLSMRSLGAMNNMIAQSDINANGMSLQMASRVWRYNGEDWIQVDLASLGLASGESLQSVSFGEDIAVRTIASGGSVARFDLVAFDANTGAWSSKATAQPPGSGQGVGVAPRTRNQESRYVALGNHLYYMNSDLAWAAATGAATIDVIAAQAPSVSVLGSQFLLYEKTGGGGADTVSCSFLGNGTVASGPVEVAGKLLVNGKASTFLIGQTAFAAYTGTWNGDGFVLTLYRPVSGDVHGKQSAVTVSSAVADAGYQAENVTIPGVSDTPVALSGPIAMAYQFDPNGATVQALGATPNFNHLTVFPGSTTQSASNGGQSETYLFNGLASGENPVHPSPANDNYTNANGMSALTVGIPYESQSKKVEDGTATVVSQTVEYSWVALSPAPNGWSVWLRQRKQTDMLDNVTKTKTTAYSSDTGLPTSATDDNVAADGKTITRTSAFKYFWEEYDQNRSLNLLAPIIQTTSSAQKEGEGSSVPIDSLVITWEQTWPSGVTGWGPKSSYRRTQNSATAFNAWQPGQTPPAGWQKTYTVADRNPSGTVITSINAQSNYQASLYGTNSGLEVASFDNGSLRDFSYYGFESYEQPGGWIGINGRSLSALITNADSHTGQRCAQLPKSSGSGALLTPFAPSNVSGSYVFSCWSRPLEGFDKTSGVAQAALMLYWTESGAQKSHELGTLILGDSAGTWQYNQMVVDFGAAYSGATPDAGSVYATATLGNGNTTVAVNVDELRLTPLLGTFEATVYDPQSLLITTSIDNNGQCLKTLYDDFLRPLATVVPLEAVQSIDTSGFSSQQGAAGSFQQNAPNTAFSITPGTYGSYDDFRSDTLANWEHTDAGGTWLVADGKLQYTGGTGMGLGGTASPKNSNTENFAMWIRVQPASSSTASVGDGNVYLKWMPGDSDQPGTYSFVSVGNGGALTTLQQTATMPYGNDWLFVAIDGLYYAAIDGVPILCVEMDSAPSSGKLTLTAGKGAAFDNLLRIDEPSLSVTFTDGLGRTIQTVSVEGRIQTGGADRGVSVMVNGAFSDSMGRNIIRRQPLTAQVGLSAAAGDAPQYLLGTPTEYVVKPNGPSNSLQDYLTAGINGTLTFISDIYEMSPLSRIAEYIYPRPASAGSGDGYKSTVSYGATDTPTPPTSAEALGDAGNFYRKETQTQIAIDPGDSSVISQVEGEITDKSGRTVLTYNGPVGGPYLQKEMTYNTIGQLTAVTESNALSLIEGAEGVAPSFVQRFAYDDLQRVVSATGPDLGQVQVMYDSADQVRFSMDAEGAAAKIRGSVVQRIRYTRYDALGRVVESGFIQDSGYQWRSAALAGKIEDQSFPKVAGGSGSGTQINGVWRVKNQYDSDGTATTKGLLGRLWQSQTQDDQAQGLITRSYAYDAMGRESSVSETVPWSSPTSADDTSNYTTQYTYSADGQLSSVIYPELDGNSIGVGYFYDRLGRPAGVGIPVKGGEVIDPTKPVPETAVRYAGYSYDASGRLSTVSVNQPPAAQSPAFRRQFQYDDDDRLIGIDDPYMGIALSYDKQNNTAYTDARITEFGLQYKISNEWRRPPSAIQYSYQYDDYGRITNAKTPLSDAYGFQSPATETTGGYDKNGNRHQVIHGSTRYTYAYPSDDTGPANGIKSITPAIAVTLNFEGATGNSSGAWSWGSSNGGPSSSHLSTDNPHSGTQCLLLGGGNSLGHMEVLTLDSFLDSRASLRLSAWVRTTSGYAGQAGNQAYWQLEIHGINGVLATKQLNEVPANADWMQQTVVVDVAGICNQLGMAESATRCLLSLVNATHASNGGSGAAIYVDDIALNWTSPPVWTVGHDLNGNVKSLPQNALTLSIDSFLEKPVSAQKGTGNAAKQLKWMYDNQSQYRQEVVQDNGSNTLKEQRNFYDLKGNLIARQTIEGGNTSTGYFVNGPNGLIASQFNDKTNFALSDQFGSLRAWVDGDTNQVLGSFDFQTFGELIRSGNNDLSSVRFMRNERNEITGLIMSADQLYDSELGRFLIAQASEGNLVPYIADQNNPVNWKNVLIGTGIAAASLAGLGVAIAFFFPGALTAAWAATAAFAAKAGTLAWAYGLMALSAGTMAYDLYSDPSLAAVGGLATGLLANTLSLYTAVPLYQWTTIAFNPIGGSVMQAICGVGAVAVQGVASGAFKRFFDSYISPTPMDSENQAGFFEQATYDAAFAIAGHALLNKGNFMSAAVTRANYQGAKTHEFYLKFPRLERANYNNVGAWGMIKAMLVPYKGITSGEQAPLYNVGKRHYKHDWNGYGYGAVIPVLSTDNKQAMLYAEMLLMKIFGRATALQAVPGKHGVGWPQNFTPGTLTAARQQEFIKAFVTRNIQNVLNPMHVFQSWYNGTV